MNKEAMLLRQLFEFGRRHKYTLDIPIIKLPNSKKRSINAKPGFTLKEFLRLESVSLSRIAEAEQVNDQDKLLNKRRKLHCYVMIAGYTGMRPTELKRMIWGDIGERELELENGQTYQAIILQVRGKGKEREMVPLPEVLTHLNILRSLFHLEIGRVPKDNDPVFANPNGSAIQSFKSGLAELLKTASLRTSADGRLRDSGSFRPFYISQQIREGVNPHMLIRNTGTSGNMVNEHYNKILPTEEIAKLTPDWLKRRGKIIQKS
jgi:integrase